MSEVKYDKERLERMPDSEALVAAWKEANAAHQEANAAWKKANVAAWKEQDA